MRVIFIILFCWVTLIGNDFENAINIGLNGDHKTSVKLLKQLAQKGDAKAQFVLGGYYIAGTTEIKQNIQKGCALLIKSAKNGLPEAKKLLKENPSACNIKEKLFLNTSISQDSNNFFSLNDILQLYGMGHAVFLSQFFSVYGLNKYNTFCKVDLNGKYGDYICVEKLHDIVKKIITIKVYTKISIEDTPKKLKYDFEKRLTFLKKELGKYSCKSYNTAPLIMEIEHSSSFLKILKQCTFYNKKSKLDLFLDASQGGGDIVTIFSNN